MSSSTFQFAPLAGLLLRKNVASHVPSSASTALASPPASHRKFTIPSSLNTDLMDIELQPLPSPYSPVATTSSTLLWTERVSSLDAMFPATPKATQAKPLSMTTSSSNTTRTGANVHPHTSMTILSPASHHEGQTYQAWEDGQAVYVDSELESLTFSAMNQPIYKKSTFVSEGLTRWESRDSLCSALSTDSESSTVSHEHDAKGYPSTCSGSG